MRRTTRVLILSLGALAPPLAHAESDECRARRQGIEAYRGRLSETRPEAPIASYEKLVKDGREWSAKMSEAEALAVWHRALEAEKNCDDCTAAKRASSEALGVYHAIRFLEANVAKLADARSWDTYDRAMFDLGAAEIAMQAALAAAQAAFDAQQAKIQTVREQLRDKPRDSTASALVQSTRAEALQAYQRIRGGLGRFDCYAEVGDFIAKQLDPRISLLQSQSGGGGSPAGTSSTGTTSPTVTGAASAPNVVGMRTQQAIDTLGGAGFAVGGITVLPAPSAEQVDTIAAQTSPGDGKVALTRYGEFKTRPADDDPLGPPSGRATDLLGYWTGTRTPTKNVHDREFAPHQWVPEAWSILIVRRGGEIFTNCFGSPHGATWTSLGVTGTQSVDGGRLTCEIDDGQRRRRLVVQARGSQLVGRHEESLTETGKVFFQGTIDARRVDPHPSDLGPLDE